MALVIACAALTAMAGSLHRAGYTTDEEFTLFAVRGIAAHGLPLLPSGLLYDRGLAYSYLGWAAGGLGGSTLPTLRLLSLLCGGAALLVLFRLVRTSAGTTTALLAVVLVTTSLPFWAVATTARFYAPFLLCVLLALEYAGAEAPALATNRALPADPALHTSPDPMCNRGRNSGRNAGLRQGAMLFGVVMLGRLTHELAFLLAAIPAVAVVVGSFTHRRRAMVATAVVLGALVAAQGLIFALHYVPTPVPAAGLVAYETPAADSAPASAPPETMINRFFVWQVLNLFERPPVVPPAGLLLVGVVVAMLWRGRMPAIALWPTAALATTIGVLHGAEAFAYPLDLFWHLVKTMPLVPICTMTALLARACGVGGAWSPAARAAHGLWLLWVVFFGVIDSGITINYLLLPVTFMLVALAIDMVAIGRALPLPARGRPWLGAAALVALSCTQWGTSVAVAQARLNQVRPTIAAPADAHLAELATGANVVACTDELACLLLAGRVDVWLALDDFLRERFVVVRAGRAEGVYAGSPVVTRLASLLKGVPAGADPPRLLVVDVFKDLPMGSSRMFLTRALTAEGVHARTLLETAQLRVVELIPAP